MKTKKESICIGTRVTRPMLQAVEEILASRQHMNMADYLRELIRKDIENRALEKEEDS